LFLLHFDTRTAHDQISDAESHLFLCTVHTGPHTYILDKCTSLVKSRRLTRPGEYLNRFTLLKVFASRSEGDYSLHTPTVHEHSHICQIQKSYWTDSGLHLHGIKRTKSNCCSRHYNRPL
jgi:hypothetical protein